MKSRFHAQALASLLLVVVVGACALAPPNASASPTAPLTWATACAADLDVATCERDTWIANALDARGDGLAAVEAGSDAADSLNLVWWGIWALVGLSLVAIVASMWVNAFGFHRKGV